MLEEFILLSIAHMIAVASPGADFAVVVKNTLRYGQSCGFRTAIGVGCGIAIHLIYTLLGLAIIFSQSEMLFNSVKYLGAVYLLWLAWQAFQSRPKIIAVDTAVVQPVQDLSGHQAFRQGFLTNVFNPKVTLFFLVLFTNIISQNTPVLIQSLYGLWLVLYTVLWFVIVAWFFSRAKVLTWYQNHGFYFDWAMGSFFVFVAVKLFLAN